MRNSTNIFFVAVACASALIAFSGSAEETEAPQGEPLELPFPSSVAADSKAIELARLWVVQGRLHVSIRTQALEEPTEWGAVLAEVARHIGNYYVQHQSADRNEILDSIAQGFEAKLDRTPDGLTGRVSQ
jgi:hypothetical protein